LVVSGSYQVAGYSVETGEKLWWLDGMAWQAKSVPVIAGDTLFLHSWMAELSELVKVPQGKSWEEFAAEFDKDGDKAISREEAPDKEMTKLWFLFDLDRTGKIEKADYEIIRARTTAKSGLYAVRLGGRGDLTAQAILWRAEKSLPNIPSPLLYKGVLYILKEGGILTAYDPTDGRILKQGRIEGAVEGYYASPIAGDGKVFTAAQDGKVAVLSAGADWRVLKVNDLQEEIWATPAIESGRLYLRTQSALYCFAAKKAR
jgi:outer membrane protein assembly factor BamB